LLIIFILVDKTSHLFVLNMKCEEFLLFWLDKGSLEKPMEAFVYRLP